MSDIMAEMRRRDLGHVQKGVVESAKALRMLRVSGKFVSDDKRP
jgi:hypothetical protein